MLISTRGIVLQSIKYSDHSLVVKIFTRKNGLVSFIVKSAFSRKSSQPCSFFAPLTLLSLTYNETHHTDKLSFIKEVNIIHPFHNISTEIGRNCILLFYQELFMKLLYQAFAPDELLFDHLFDHLVLLETTQKIAPDFHIVFTIQLIQVLGYAPECNYSTSTPYFSIEESRFEATQKAQHTCLSKVASYYLYTILKNQPYSPPDKKTRMELLNGLILYLMKYNKQITAIESVGILSDVLN